MFRISSIVNIKEQIVLESPEWKWYSFFDCKIRHSDRTEFIQLVGITAEEANRIAENKENIPGLIGLMKADGNAELVTDMARTKSYLQGMK